MKKRTIKTIALCCSACLAFSVFASCNDKGGGVGKLEPTNNTTAITEEYTGGTHIFTAEDTAKDLVKNGACDYQIVFPSSFTAQEELAVQEFTTLFEMATNIELTSKRDNGLTHNASAKYISIGNTRMLHMAGIDTDVSDLGRDGCRVVTKDNTIYIFGGSDGVIYGVYDFMAVTFDYECYYTDCIEIDTNVKNMKLKNYDIKDIPDIEERAQGWSQLFRTVGGTEEESLIPTRMRQRYRRAAPFLPIHQELGNQNSPRGASSHGSVDYWLPPAQYASAHPKWYANRGTDQLCWTARGDEAEFELMVETLSQKVIQSLQWYTPDKTPEYTAVLLSIEDNTRTCTCSKCAELLEKYGTNGAAGVILMNRISEIVDAWMELPENAAYKREDFKYLFLSYTTFEGAPVKYDEAQGKYVPIDALVTPRPNVGPYIAMMFTFDYQLSIYDELNAGGLEDIDQWTDITEFQMYWFYSVNYRDAFLPYDSFNFFNDAFRYFANQGVRSMVIQGMTAGGQFNPVAWGSLQMYLHSKLMWNVNLDANELIDNWFNAMFKEGAPEMKQFFDEIRGWNMYLMEEYDLFMIRSNYTDLKDVKYWNMPMLQRWMDLCDSALAKVEKYKTRQPELYAAIKDHIELEWGTPAYLTLYLYHQDLSSTDKYALIERFDESMERLEVTQAPESASAGQTLKDFIASIS